MGRPSTWMRIRSVPTMGTTLFFRIALSRARQSASFIGRVSGSLARIGLFIDLFAEISPLPRRSLARKPGETVAPHPGASKGSAAHITLVLWLNLAGILHQFVNRECTRDNI